MRSKLFAISVFTLIASLTGCVTAPWACTPETCAVIASEPVPEELFGRWEQTDEFAVREGGIGLHIAHAYKGDSNEPEAAVPVGNLAYLSVGTEIGFVLLADDELVVEWHANRKGVSGSKRPRRFARLRLSEDTLEWRTFDLDRANSSARDEDEIFAIVAADNGPAVTYTDLEAMHTRLGELAADDAHWGEPTVYRRVR